MDGAELKAQEKEEEEKKKSRNTFFVMFFTLLSRLLGIVRIRVFGSVYGASSSADAINFAFNIPNNFRKLFSEGALSSAIVPEFSTLNKEEKELQPLFSSFLGIQIIFAAVILAFTFLLREPIVLLLSDFSQADQNLLAMRLLPYFSLFLVFILFSSYFSSVLQSINAVILQSAAPLLFSISVIFCIHYLNGGLGPMAMALGAVSGGFFQMLVTFIRLRTKGLKFRVSFDFSLPEFRRVISKWVPAIGSSAITIVSTQIAFYFATGMGEGSVSAFSNSLIFWQTPYGIFYSAIATVYFPEMSKKREMELVSTYAEGLERLTNFLVPSAIFLFFFRNDVVSVVLQTGNFTMENSLLTSQLLGFFLMGMPFVAWYAFSQKLCFCISKHKMVLWISFAVCILDLTFTLVFISLGLEVKSLAISNGISNLAGFCLIQVLVIRKNLPRVPFGKFFLHILKVFVLSIPMILFCIIIKIQDFTYWMTGSSVTNLLIFCGISVVAVGLVLLFNKIGKNRLF